MNKEKNEEENAKAFLKNQMTPHSQFQKLKSYKNAANSSLFETEIHETYGVNILPDKKVARGKFVPTLNPREFHAHPVTISAMKKELFMGGDDFIDLECLYTCQSCHTTLDLQFWKFCPFCECSFT